MKHRFSISQGLVTILLTSMFTSPAWAVDYAYKVTMTLTSPKGSAGEKLATSQPTSTKLAPCSDAKPDQVTITVTYDAGKTTLEKRDLFLLLHSPTDGLYALKKGPPPTISGPFTSTTLVGSVSANIYLPAADNLGQGAQTDTVMAGYINLETIATGTWQVVAIIANSTTVDFDDPATWAAWDVTTLLVGKPWVGTAKTVCGSGFLP